MNKYQVVRRCKKCDRMLRPWNKSGLCTNHYILKGQADRKKLKKKTK